MFALLGLFLATSKAIPDGSVYRDSPAAMSTMYWLVGRWRYPENKPDATGLKVIRPKDWMTIRIEGPGKLAVHFTHRDPKSIFYIPVTQHDGRLYAQIDMCALLGPAADLDRCRFAGKPCQYPILLEHRADDDLALRPIDRVATHAANPWLRPVPPPTEYLDDDRCDGALFGMTSADQRRFVFVAESSKNEQRYRRMRVERAAAEHSLHRQ